MENGIGYQLVSQQGGTLTMSGEGDFGAWLAPQLAAKDISQSALARRVGVATGTVGRWINEGRKPLPRTIEPIAQALGVSVDEVLTAAGMLTEDNARVGPRARLLDLIRWLPDQEVEAVLAFAEFRADRARASMRLANSTRTSNADVDGGYRSDSDPDRSSK